MKQAKTKTYGGVGRYESGTSTVPKKMLWHKKALWLIVALSAVETVNLTLWQLGAIPATLSIFTSEIMTCVVSFLVGRIYERLGK